ncbi:hypothetical protein CK215_04310 [Mesorhizobium sp. WSM3864]|uniref:DUF7940 domain-containing protein n=1 Tax=Mesorhizobium sp. WSM3864 TaxID=2029404 RepID=UPI000BAF52CB|nr:hypothetical protein [Mesorhizobium sp. WSM3864]PBB93206.1 hypothetical protein CK215_04310 [Mesorhizobium sp. WSM3864]
MKLLPDWRRVLARAWSMRLIELAFVSNFIINVVPSIADFLPWWLTLLLLGSAWTARLIWQPDKVTTDADKQDPVVKAG